MAVDPVEYARHFQAGGRVRVGIPLEGGGSFQEWGVVLSLDGDLLELELSRDALPQQATLRSGGALQLGVLHEERVLVSRGVVAAESKGHRLLLRLVDGVVPFEPREFFRQDVSLPLDYRLPPSQDFAEIREGWRRRLWAQEFAGQEPELGESEELSSLRKEIQERLERKRLAPPWPANISGGGVRLNLEQKLRPGLLVELSIYLPAQKRCLEMVGEVVQVAALPDQRRFSTALRYRLIDEADRDRLIGYISAQQLQQLALHAPRNASLSGLEGGRARRRLRLALGLALLALLLGFEMHDIVAKREKGEKHEIERVFEEAIADYLKRR